MMMLIEFTGKPPPRIASAFAFPVVRRRASTTIPRRIVDLPSAPLIAIVSLLRLVGVQEPADCLHEPMLGQRLLEERRGARLARARLRGEQAEDENLRVPRLCA